MKIKFNLDYQTVYGQDIVLNVIDAAKPDNVHRHALKTTSTTTTVWNMLATNCAMSGW